MKLGSNWKRIAAPISGLMAFAFLITACTPSPPIPDIPNLNVESPEFHTNGWEILTDIASPMTDRIQVDLATVEVDDSGLALYRDLETGDVVPHPIVNAQYAIAALMEWERTNDDVWLDRVKRNANELVDTHVERDGAWWFQYDWDWTYLERTLTAPWWSGMAQGEALTVFSQLAQIEPENRTWRHAADKTFESFLQRGSGNEIPWSTVIDNEHL